MNTLLGELATLNDVQYPRYRTAFKFRKLQRTLFLDSGEVGMLSEVMHLTGLQGLRNDDVVPLSQLSTVLNELYGAIRTARPVLKPVQIQQAQDWAYNWFQIAYKTSSGGQITATHLKISLCLFLGSKLTDKARFIFGQLANTNGAIEKEGLRFFVRVLQQLAYALQENIYDDYTSLDKVFQDCLIFVRDSEDIEEEQLDGGIRRQWLSQFEFTKLLTASPPPDFLSWLHLWFTLPGLETVVHSVRCSVCARKPIIAFRYQCMQCHNYHMCQMCFLKGRTGDKHQLSHQVLEFSSKGRAAGRSWHHRLLGLPHRGAAMGGKMVADERKLFSFRPESRASHNSSNDEADIAMTAITDMVMTNSKMSPISNGERRGSHQPEMIRIGSDGKPAFSPKKAPPEVPAAHTLQTSPARRVSYTSSSSSPDSVSSGGAKFSFEGTRVSRTSSGSAVAPEKPVVTVEGRRMKTTASDSTVTTTTKGTKDLTAINKRLSMEVDQILMDLPPPSNRATYSLPRNSHTLVPTYGHRDNRSLDHDLQGIQKEEEQLQVQVSQLTDKREKLSHELQDLISQVQQMQVGFQTLGRKNHTNSWARLSSPPYGRHARSDSAPMLDSDPLPPSPPSSPENSLPPVTETEISPEPAAVIKHHKEPLERSPDGYKPRVYTPPLSTAPFHDPLSEYHAEEDTDSSHPGTTPDHRLSVAW